MKKQGKTPPQDTFTALNLFFILTGRVAGCNLFKE